LGLREWRRPILRPVITKMGRKKKNLAGNAKKINKKRRRGEKREARKKKGIRLVMEEGNLAHISCWRRHLKARSIYLEAHSKKIAAKEEARLFCQGRPTGKKFGIS